jgi:hypothetical protein
MGLPFSQRMAIRLARLLGPDMTSPQEKWWFDMEYVDDVIELRD